MALDNQEREFLSQEYRFFEIVSQSEKTKNPEAREGERLSNLTSRAAATAVLTPIHEMISKEKKIFTVTTDGIIDISFRKRPPRVNLKWKRYGLSGSRNFLCLSAIKDRGQNKTILTLYG